MISPHKKLLQLILFFLFPLSFISVIIPLLFLPVLLVFLFFIIILVYDIYQSISLFDQIDLILPQTLRITHEKWNHFDIKLKNDLNLPVRVGFEIPESINQEIEENYQNKDQLEIKFFAQKRGKFDITKSIVGTISKFGFWQLKSKRTIELSVLVYPNLSKERNHLASFFLKRGLSGIHHRRQLGKGREFEKLREYIPGDAYEDIHWKATARRRNPITKVFQIEKTQQIYLLFDCSRYSNQKINIADQSTILMEKYLTSGLAVASAAQRQGDAIGMLAFDRKVTIYRKAKAGKIGFQQCRDSMYSIQPSSFTPNYEELFTFIRSHIRKRSFLIMFCSLENQVQQEAISKYAPLIANQHVMLIMMIQQDRTHKIFKNSNVHTLNDIRREIANHQNWEKIEETKRKLRISGVQLQTVKAEHFSTELISSYINLKQRQLL